MNTNLQNVDMSNGIGLLNSHTLPQDNKSSNLNEMNMSIGNCDVNGGYFYMNISTVSESNIHNYIYYTKKRMDYWMVLVLMQCYLHPHLINMPIWNTIMNLINF